MNEKCIHIIRIHYFIKKQPKYVCLLFKNLFPVFGIFVSFYIVIKGGITFNDGTETTVITIFSFSATCFAVNLTRSGLFEWTEHRSRTHMYIINAFYVVCDCIAFNIGSIKRTLYKALVIQPNSQECFSTNGELHFCNRVIAVNIFNQAQVSFSKAFSKCKSKEAEAGDFGKRVSAGDTLVRFSFLKEKNVSTQQLVIPPANILTLNKSSCWISA